ncbi:MAG: cupredoxin domain-containing protein [Candidatus Ratteibacteria bacterium]
MKRILKGSLLLMLVFGLLLPLASAVENPGICPVLGGKASPSVSYQYKGKTYYFCCAACISDFKKNPEKYLSRIKEFNVVAKKYAFVPAEIRVKQNDIVRINFTSEDVAHGLTIKEYGINVPVNKGETKKIEFLADKKGTFVFRCSVFCGFGHSGMTGKLIVE